MHPLSNLRIAVLATDGFEESELTEPVKALRDAGGFVEIISLKKGPIQAVRGLNKTITVEAAEAIEKADPNLFDALVLPGGPTNADTLRTEPLVQDFIRSFFDDGKPVAAICHAPWELISAGVVKSRRLTGYKAIQDDIKNAGGDWVDEEVVVEGNLVTSRMPADLPAFNREMIKLFSQVPQSAAA